MAASILPQDVAEHLEAAIRLSNGRVHMRFLDEAEVLLALNLPGAAVVIASVVLEFVRMNLPGQPISEQQRVEQWLSLRNRVAHSHAAIVTLDQAREMVKDVRVLLTREIKLGTLPAGPETRSDLVDEIRGRYKSVPTSSTEFIHRKSEELRLEDDGHSH